MRQPIVKDLRSKTKAKDLTSKAKANDFIKCPRGAKRRLQDFITDSTDQSPFSEETRPAFLGQSYYSSYIIH